jgi:hypothetical protein
MFVVGKEEQEMQAAVIPLIIFCRPAAYENMIVSLSKGDLGFTLVWVLLVVG